MYGVNDSDDKRISKTFAEISVCYGVRQDITNKLQHRKCVRLEMSINTYLEVQSKETTQKMVFNKHLKDIISNKL